MPCAKWLLTGLILTACSSAPTRVWIAGDVQMTGECARRLAALDTWPGTGIVNLEGPVGPPRPLSAQQLYNTAAVVPALVARGVKVVGMANNHRLDRGAAGSTVTRRAIVDAGARPADRARPARWRVNGRQVQVTAGEPGDLAQMQADLRQPADLHIASLHVVAPPSYLPDADTRATVEALLKSGADVVAVHGSHAVAAVEWRGRQLIAWGLGNLAFDCRCTQEDEGMVLLLAFDEAGLKARVVPIRAGLMGAPVTAHPDAAGVLDLLRGLGSPLDAQGRLRAGAQTDAQREDVGR
jgi:hypothetical protein